MSFKENKKHMWKEMLSSSPKRYAAGLADTLQAMPATCHMNVSSTHSTALGLPRIRPKDQWNHRWLMAQPHGQANLLQEEAFL